jgi:ketosteroid isomerase-like protein
MACQGPNLHSRFYAASANRSKDVEARTSNYSKNVRVFDVVDPLEYFGLDAVKARAANWFWTFEGPLQFENHDLRIATDNDVAFSYSLNHVTGMKRDGTKVDMWWRATVCYRKMDDQWVVAHEHNSVPFQPETGKASLNLKP